MPEKEQFRPSEEVIKRGNIFELVHLSQEDGRIFEVARRAPGVRVIIADKINEKILLTREFRRELNAWDYRLPGGKVFDSLEEYGTFRGAGGDILVPAKSKAIDEAAEEAGIVISALHEVKKSTLGATVEWDLYIFEADAWSQSDSGQKLETGERIEADAWVSYKEAQAMIMDGKMQEERVALSLLQWLHIQKEKE
ncbi:MAG TPA: NUDIX hydrolase [Candidatus Saccharibacteria bacterium]|mgnify:CR=1 FL=1|nr:NUDIX hydrolase [Candidatus Saccharibacteria bacterium]HRQ98244.1 NUDIX hydrolase [Candidatus Saccharibacteria bacterium]